MLRVEKYKAEGQEQITCLSCGNNENPTAYSIKLYNPLGEWRLPLCQDCYDRLKVELEFLDAIKEEGEEDDDNIGED